MQTVNGQQGLVVEGINGSDMSGVMQRMQALRDGNKAALQAAGMDRALSEAQYVGVMQYMLSETLQGLIHLEQHGVVHNDIRPDNIMCSAETGEVKILDFGVAVDAGRPRPADALSPIGHGSPSPDWADFHSAISAKHDVFSAGEIARLGMEGDQFRYNGKQQTGPALAKDLVAYGRPDQTGRMQTALRKKDAIPSAPPLVAPANDQQRLRLLITRVKMLVTEPFLKGTDAARDLMQLCGAAIEQFEIVSDPDVVDRSPFDRAMQTLEARVIYAETNYKTSGTYAIESDYTKFVNKMMSPDRNQRPSASQALQDPFLAQPLLEPMRQGRC
jgi:serine/threonine protein kinase